jgi:hypothetical protein
MTERKEHALVVAWYRKDGNIFMLTGTESSYPRLVSIPETKDKVGAIIASLPHGARYVGREFDKASRKFKSYSIQTVKDDSKKGFPKGGMTGQDKGDVKNTAFREFQEEVGFDLNKAKLQNNGNHGGSTLFTYEVTEHEKEGIEKAIEKMEKDRKGELFHVAFRRASTIASDLDRFNAPSKAAFNYLRRDAHFQNTVKHGGGKNQTRKRKHKQLRKRAKRQTRK